MSVGQIAEMALGYGLAAGTGGAVLGTTVGFGALRRVPLGRLPLYTNLGFAAGLTAGWLGGPWAWHNLRLLGVLGFAAGAALAHLVTRPKLTPPHFLPSSHLGALDAASAPDPLAPPVFSLAPCSVSAGLTDLRPTAARSVAQRLDAS